MAGKPQHLKLTPEQDEQLRGLEMSPHVKPKIRLRAQVIRLNAAGWSRRQIATHTRRTYGTICQDLKRWGERGLDGLADAPATNQPEKLSQPIRAFVCDKLQEERIWTCTHLIEAVEKQFGIRVGREAMRLRILRLGYCWKRTRYVPCKEIAPEVLQEHQASLETLKRGRSRSA